MAPIMPAPHGYSCGDALLLLILLPLPTPGTLVFAGRGSARAKTLKDEAAHLTDCQHSKMSPPTFHALSMRPYNTCRLNSALGYLSRARSITSDGSVDRRFCARSPKHVCVAMSLESNRRV